MNVKADKDRKDTQVIVRMTHLEKKRLEKISSATGIAWSELIRAMIASVPGATKEEIETGISALIHYTVRKARKREEDAERRYKNKRAG